MLILGSIVLDDEVDEIQDKMKRAAVIELISRAVAERITVVSESKQNEIREATGVKEEDAFHLAAALEGRAEYFLTVDDNILAKADKIEAFGLKVQNPVDLIEEKEGKWRRKQR